MPFIEHMDHDKQKMAKLLQNHYRILCLNYTAKKKKRNLLNIAILVKPLT